MQPIHINVHENVISRSPQGLCQELAFVVHVENLSYEKEVTIHWCGEDGVWHELHANFHSMGESGIEEWRAAVHVPLTEKQALPGNIEFAVSYSCAGRTYWDNNGGSNYKVDADAGLLVYNRAPVQHVFHEPELQGGKSALPIDTAVASAVRAKKVWIHWSSDHWKTRHKVAAKKRVNHWDLARGSASRNPNRYGWEMWSGQLPVDQAYRVQYAIEAVTDSGSIWDNGGGTNYAARRGTLRVLTLNLHCYQEKDQDKKFRRIARAIDEQHVDIVCFQEVGELWNDGAGDWASNAAHIINTLLPGPYHLYTDYSHLGFEKYREGIAVLSRYAFTRTDSAYVSESSDIYDIHARRVLFAQIHVPYFGPINVFSAHLSWPDGGFQEQFKRLQAWAEAEHDETVVATLLCGDFNIKAGSTPYQHIVNESPYEDQYLKATAPDRFAALYAAKRKSKVALFEDDGRIDYVFLRRGSVLDLVNTWEIFTPTWYGRVSDHTGYLAEFELA